MLQGCVTVYSRSRRPIGGNVHQGMPELGAAQGQVAPYRKSCLLESDFGLTKAESADSFGP